MPWSGVEILDVHRVAFSWYARFPILPFVWLTAQDAYKDGAGSLEGRLWGRIRLFCQTGIDVDVGEALLLHQRGSLLNTAASIAGRQRRQGRSGAWDSL
jgi:hypothetical protein